MPAEIEIGKGDGRDPEPGPSAPRRTTGLPVSHIIALVVGVASIGGFAAYVIHHNYDTTLDRWRAELGASVHYQTWTLQNSLEQSQDDAQVLADFASTKRLLTESDHDAQSGAQVGPREALQQQVLSLFEEYRNIYEYGAIYLLDDRGGVAVQATDSKAPSTVVGSAEFRVLFGSVIRKRNYAVELERNSARELTLVFMMPVFGGTTDRSRTPTHAPIGIVAIVDPFSRDLLPLLTAKRVISRSGETVLLQLEAGEGQYASPRRYVINPALPVTAPDTLRRAASSAVETHAAFGQFVDYRGVGVMAAMEKIPSIHSVVVCKVDNDEAFADFRRVVSIETVTAVSILLAYVGLILMHNRRAVAREMREGLARQQFVNQVLETTVAQRTSQLAQTNQQLHQELGERLKAEEEVRKINTELDHRVHQRTLELEAANKELEAFSYSVSHDLRAPLRAVSVFVGMLMEDYGPQLPEEGRTYLEWIRKGGEQMGCLIDDLLAFSRLGRSSLNRRRVDTAKLVGEVLSELNAEIAGREIEIEVGDLPPGYGDPALLKQVWVNLLSNAIKYSRGRKPARVEIGCRREENEDVYLVRDNGTGFDMRYAHKLFGVFQRLHRADEFEGTGVGLAIVQRIIHRHGGRVWAEAEQDHGAAFRFTLGGEDES